MELTLTMGMLSPPVMVAETPVCLSGVVLMKWTYSAVALTDYSSTKSMPLMVVEVAS